MVILCNNDEFIMNDNYDIYTSYFNEFPFELSNFQKWSIKAIVDGQHSLITAHTGSGKTLPAEFAIKYFTGLNKKVIYTTPLKALSNQKLYDFRRKFPDISFGLLTGDIKDNPEADVLIMTTEILRNTLFNKQIQTTNTNEESKNDNKNKKLLAFDMDFENELALVCFDEVHFIGDPDRGSVWEQSIMLLPKHVQMLMLSATIDKPETFAKWVEEQNPMKSVYLSSTYERVVPLTHYMWLTLNQSQIKKTEKTEYEDKVKQFINKKVEIVSPNNVFNEINYYKMMNLVNYIEKNQIRVNRQFVLNGLIKHLYDAKLLPAICFVLSRKNVEKFANEIELNLFDEEEEIPPMIERECRKLLYTKFNNNTVQEIMLLPEYTSTINLLKKGIAIHHAGILPIIREMVELLFEKNYIKLLFATETFAVGINMPTKTVIFTGMDKFNGSQMRHLYSHEYKQMAGRAGRRGIDTIGYVIHCNNLFEQPSAIEYKTIMTGPPQMLSSKFKISFNLILSILLTDLHGFSQLEEFISKSMITNDIRLDMEQYDREIETIRNTCVQNEDVLQYCQTPKEVIMEYIEKKNKIHTTTNKAKHKLNREINEIEEFNRFIKLDADKYNTILDLKKDIEILERKKQSTHDYLHYNIENIISILIKHGFVDDALNVTSKGQIASSIQEIHPLAISELYEETEGFKSFTAAELAALFSCFTNLSIGENVRYQSPFTKNKLLNDACKKVNKYYEMYYDAEVDYKMNTGCDYNIHYQIIDEILEWCECTNEVECNVVINKIKNIHEVFLGEFVKAILKINNIASEFESICEINGNVELLHKIKDISRLTLKYVATNISLYI